jgi:hypothetical protein
VILQHLPDSTTRGVVTDVNGKFRFERIAPGEYLVKVSYLGFEPFAKPVVVGESAVNLGSLSLQEETTALLGNRDHW